MNLWKRATIDRKSDENEQKIIEGEKRVKYQFMRVVGKKTTKK
jgi:hypothetical protein